MAPSQRANSPEVHWVPTATAPLEQLCAEWAAKEKVDIAVDFITSNGDKDLLTMAAEAQAKSGHDVLQFTSWYATGQAENLEPVDDIVSAIIAQNGGPTKAAEYLGKSDSYWIAVRPVTAARCRRLARAST